MRSIYSFVKRSHILPHYISSDSLQFKAHRKRFYFKYTPKSLGLITFSKHLIAILFFINFKWKKTHDKLIHVVDNKIQKTKKHIDLYDNNQLGRKRKPKIKYWCVKSMKMQHKLFKANVFSLYNQKKRKRDRTSKMEDEQNINKNKHYNIKINRKVGKSNKNM